MAKGTKNKIFQAFTELLDEYDLDKITITTLVSKCQISRQTFYYHFNDIESLIDWSVRQSAEGCLEEAKKANSITHATIIFLKHIKEHKTFLSKCLNSSLSGYTTLLIRNSIIEYFTEFVCLKNQDTELNEDTKFVINFISDGVVGLILTVIYENKDIDIEYLANQIIETVLNKLI